LRDYIHTHPFATISDEIYYFKNTHPVFISDFIYYTLRHKHEIDKFSVITKKALKILCKQKLDLIQKYFNNQHDFIVYYKSNASHFDDKYFIRNNQEFLFTIDDCLSMLNDPSITGYDLIAARYLAYLHFSEFLYSEIKSLSAGNIIPNIDPTWEIPADSVWTDSKRNLTELLYALAAVGSVNYGNFDIIKFAVLFEHVFHIDLGNVYHTFTEIKECKNPTQFLDKLRDEFRKKLNEGEK
jgi:hypothetical protein